MINNIYVALRWSVSLGRKIFRVVPGATLAVVFVTLVSQFSIVVASLLPLKVVMLLGSDRVPRYFPDFFSGIDRDLLIVSLSVLAVCFYFLHSFSEKLVVYGSGRGADSLLERSQKMTLFENQTEIARQGFQRYSRSLSSVILIFIISIGLCWLYYDLFLVLSIYSLVSFSLLALLYSYRGRVKTGLDEVPGKVVGTVTGVGFLIAFSYIVTDFLWGSPPSLLVAIISLILMRQGFSRVSGLVLDLRGLYLQRLKLNALFFHGHVLVGEAKKHETNFWSLLESPRREKWICDVLNVVFNRSFCDIKVNWLQVGVSDVAFFHVEEVDQKGHLREECLVKLFSIKKSSLARHEATLLTDECSLPSLPLLGVEDIQGLHCHILDISRANQFSKDQFSEARNKMFSRLASVSPSTSLVSRYSRSHPPLWERVDNRVFSRLRTVAEMLNVESVERVEKIIALQPEIIDRLKSLPLVVVNPDIGPNSIFQDDVGEFIAVHWGRWALEPLGAGWPVGPKQLECLGEVLSEAKRGRKALLDVAEKDVCLATLMYELEKLCVRQQFASALDLVPLILDCVGTPSAVPQETV